MNTNTEENYLVGEKRRLLFISNVTIQSVMRKSFEVLQYSLMQNNLGLKLIQIRFPYGS